jgi:hypothetical protein
MLTKFKSYQSIGRTVIGLALTLISLSLFSPRSLAAQAASQAPGAKAFDITSDPDFKDYKQVVTRFAEKHRPRKENSFCIIGFSAEDTKSAWVLWHEGGEIILWEGGDDLDVSRRIVHLKSDVVATEGEVHGSTYLVTKSWVDELSKSCDRTGLKVRVGAAPNSKTH